MRQRNEWLLWVATAVGSLGLVGLASAQPVPLQGVDEVLVQHDPIEVGEHQRLPLRDIDPRPASSSISDDGWSAELPMPRQMLVERRGAGAHGPVRIDIYNERGEVVQHIDWSDGSGDLKPVALDALIVGRYVVRVTDGKRTDVVRFRKE
jgi:hypothetical protein